MERNEIKAVIESIIFVSEEPASLDLLAMVFGDLPKKELAAIVEEIKNDFNGNPDRGLQVVEVAGGYQFRTKAASASFLQKLNVPKPVRLSQPAMETLAIVAYRQPVLRSEIENIRGVDSGGVLKTLLERGLIRIIGKSEEVGTPLLYGTAQAFLEMFGLTSLKELPTLKEIEALDVQEKVGGLGREAKHGAVARGVSEVIDEYKGTIEAYTSNPAKHQEDNRAIKDLEDSIYKLRHLEKDIFPKSEEKIEAIPKEMDEGTTPQDTGKIN